MFGEAPLASMPAAGDSDVATRHDVVPRLNVPQHRDGPGDVRRSAQALPALEDTRSTPTSSSIACRGTPRVWGDDNLKLVDGVWQ
jgi:hypothetical protein